MLFKEILRRSKGFFERPQLGPHLGFPQDHSVPQMGPYLRQGMSGNRRQGPSPLLLRRQKLFDQSFGDDEMAILKVLNQVENVYVVICNCPHSSMTSPNIPSDDQKLLTELILSNGPAEYHSIRFLKKCLPAICGTVHCTYTYHLSPFEKRKQKTGKYMGILKSGNKYYNIDSVPKS